MDLRKDKIISSDLPLPQSQPTRRKEGSRKHRGNPSRPLPERGTEFPNGQRPNRNPIQAENQLASYDSKFGSISVSRDVGRALQHIGYENPSPVQEQCIPPLLEGQDVVGQALTGTGKTAAFGIPIIEQLDPENQNVQGLVLVPTRELAMQVHRELERIAQFRHLNITACYGGQPIFKQISLLQSGTQIVVGTPGRILDHLDRRTLHLGKLRTLVLDEADEMLDIGFLPDIERILSHSPKSRQTSLFSATIPSQIRRIAYRHMRSPIWIRIGGEIETAPNVRQIYYEVLERDRVRALVQLLNAQINGGKALLFRRTQIGVERLVYSLRQQNIPVAGIHGGMTQPQRNAGMRAFETGTMRLLVATNVAARGLDIPKVTHVINYDMPQNLEEYIHRIGRTARMGGDGTAITFVSEWDFPMLDTLKKTLADELNPETLAFY
ncbi:DEAD/DEAH box helicase [SAR202 cluster bacterium AD-804-J14_MRT_500m]|nr:DEAD/DEAH box helicase [SAR202 cluster bacterium AD-804-J14_MRT_500m]